MQFLAKSALYTQQAERKKCQVCASLSSLAETGCHLAAVSLTTPSIKYSFELGFMQMLVNTTLAQKSNEG